MTTKNRFIKPVSFSKADVDILDYIESLDTKFSTYVKKLIRQDMEKASEDSDIKELLKTMNKILNSGSININTSAPDVSDRKDTNENKVTTAQKNAISSILGRR